MKTKKKRLSEQRFTTAHNLAFESGPWHRSEDFFLFRVGTCHGTWRSTGLTYDILAIKNERPGNGHFEDTMQWFSHSCRRDGKFLRFLWVLNEDLLRHLIEKRGFVAIGEHCIKKFI